MSSRDRSSGWQHAKVSGHRNEELFAADASHGQTAFELSRIYGLPNRGLSVVGGGLGEKHFASVIGSRPTTSKSDLKVRWTEAGFTARISLKKSSEGQAFLVSPERFIAGFHAHFDREIPQAVQRALHLYLGSASDSKAVLSSVPEFDARIRRQEIRHNHRMVWKTLVRHDAEIAQDLLSWFRENLADIVRFTFSRGLVAEESEWADLLIYRNLVDPKADERLAVFRIEELARSAASRPDLVVPGPRYGGSTILLPFGSLQWHKHDAQLRHKLVNIQLLLPQS